MTKRTHHVTKRMWRGRDGKDPANFFPPSGANALNFGEDSNIFDTNSPTFGQITSTFASRIMQFAARFEF